MTGIHITRFTQVLVLAATTAALAAPGAAFGDSTPTPTGTDAVATTQPLDWVERFAAAHPYGIVTSAVPRDAALGSRPSAAAHPYETVTSGFRVTRHSGSQTSATADSFGPAGATPSGDVTIAASAVRRPHAEGALLANSAFAWREFGIGAGAASGAIVLLLGLMLGLPAMRGRHEIA